MEKETAPPTPRLSCRVCHVLRGLYGLQPHCSTNNGGRVAAVVAMDVSTVRAIERYTAVV